MRTGKCGTRQSKGKLRRQASTLSSDTSQSRTYVHPNLPFAFLGHLQRSTVDNQADIAGCLPIRRAKIEAEAYNWLMNRASRFASIDTTPMQTSDFNQTSVSLRAVNHSNVTVLPLTAADISVGFGQQRRRQRSHAPTTVRHVWSMATNQHLSVAADCCPVCFRGAA